jgi:hypothetical protein
VYRWWDLTSKLKNAVTIGSSFCMKPQKGKDSTITNVYKVTMSINNKSATAS